ncbi:restriction endonuclease [Desulfoscipio gibsoniae DSM 7213]|uniref:Putative HNH nuclease YajD n=1 Tax=Desulfoscipio gibsoniae DSM 7213 TaxID=767817 RepID=R4KSR8_9FIRM|nr:HNH endonuclease signature motif containing protein [Desulfoscipio gibsoniae]AGL03635.1 restriction endonuclease [Desulfoscipio gibsoniae DSM 7213]
MPRKPPAPCRHPGCPELTEARFCPKHMQEYNRQYNRKERPKYSKQLYNSARWQRLRKKVLLEHPLCVECERQGRITPATIVDHVKPHKGNLNLFWDENNLQALCKNCHDSKTTKEGRWGDKNRVYSY